MADYTSTFYDRLVPGIGAGILGASVGAAPGLISGNPLLAIGGGIGGGLLLGTNAGRTMIGGAFKAAFTGIGGLGAKIAGAGAKGAAGAATAGLGGAAALGAGAMASAAKLWGPLKFLGGQQGSMIAGTGIRTLTHMLGVAESTIVGGANLFAGNVIGGKNKARNLEEAINLLFPYKNNPDLFMPLGKHDISKLLSDSSTAEAKAFIKGIQENKGIAQVTMKDLRGNKHLFGENFSKVEKLVEGRVGGVSGVGKNYSDSRRVGLNPKVIRRLTAATAAVSVAQGLAGSMSNNSPEPSVYYSAGNIRHMNDMGADASYARSLMGRNSRI